MKLLAPSPAPSLDLVDIYGKPIAIGAGRRTLLSFFRDAACPFCNVRVYELTHHHQNLTALVLDIVAVLGASHARYGIERSLLRKLKAIVTRVPTLLRGLRIVGFAGLDTNNLMPADFLIDEHGRIVEAYYGGDAGDRIPMERVEMFVARGLLERGVRVVDPALA